MTNVILSNTFLPLIWALIIGCGIIIYVILDGFDLGLGILFPWIHDPEHRSTMMNSVSPVWDGNETWLVLGGASLYGAFPVAYSAILPALYMPIMIMVGALVFRGVAFEFRGKAFRTAFLWDLAFAGGSTVAAFCQGLILGSFVQGNILLKGTADLYYTWLSPFSMITGIAVVFGYALLGATWLIIKTEGELQNEMYQTARVLLIAIAFFLLVVSVWTPFIHPDIQTRWFSLPNFYFLLPLPVLSLLALLLEGYCLSRVTVCNEKLPFILTICLFLFSYIGLGISTWPYIVPRQLTIWEAASNPSSLRFQLVGAIILLPMLLAYSIYSYRVFRGKVRPDMGYH
jgi:cytochrome bd ubiquinol oxidase subunit II